MNEPNMIQLLDGPCEEYAMIWILPVIFVFAYFFYKLVIRGGYMFAVGIVVTFFFSFIIAALSFGAACLTGFAFTTHAVKYSEHTLVAIRDKDGIRGQFFLGTGSISGDQYYFYYDQLPDGGLRPGKVRASGGVRIYEENRSDAKLIKYIWDFDQPWAWYVSIPIRDGGYFYEFYVPNGAIKRGFTM